MARFIPFTSAILVILGLSGFGFGNEDEQLVLQWDPPSRPPLRLTDIETKCSQVLRREEITAKVRGDILYRRSLVRAELGDLKNASTDADAAARLCPESLEIRAHAARFWAWTGQLEKVPVHSFEIGLA